MVDRPPRVAFIERIHPRSLKHWSGQLMGLVRTRLWLKVLVAMVLGAGLGIAIGPSAGWVEAGTAETIASWIALPGKIFLAMVQMIVVPLVFASIVRGLAGGESMENLRRLGLWAVFFFVSTTILAIAMGIGLALLIEPGSFIDPEQARGAIAAAPGAGVSVQAGTVPEAIVQLLPSNPLGSMVESEMLQVVIFAIFVGLALVSMRPSASRPMLELLGTLQDVSLTVVRWAMWLVPMAVFGLMAALTARLGIDALMGMSVYVGTVLGGLLLLLLVLILIVAVVGRIPPGRFLREMRDLQLLAFSTSSSAAVMPLTMRTAEEKLGVRNSVSQFVIPLGATINMNGTGLYQGVATIFLAQVFAVDLSLGDLCLVVVTAVAASIGSPAAPGVGIVILAMVLGSVGIPAAGLGLIIGVDRILDMCRTVVNVSGDVVAAVVLDRRVGGTASAEEQNAASLVREEERARSGADVIVEGEEASG